jgi:predicted Zn-dependent protease
VSWPGCSTPRTPSDYDRATDQLFGGDPVAALESIERALGTLPGEENLRLVRAGALLAAGATDDGLAELRALVADRPTWEVIVRGFASRGFVTLPEGLSIDALFA